MRCAGVFLVAVGLLPAVGGAQPYPARPVKLVVGFAPGGAADFVSRTLQDPLSRELGQQIIVENRPGAGSSIAAEYVAKSAPDGYTMLIASPSSILVNPIISPKAGFDARRDLAPVGKVTSSPLVPGVAGMAEAGLPEYEISFWYGFFFPAGTPKELVRKMFDATAAVLALAAVGKALEKEGTETAGSKSPEDFAAFLAEDAKLWSRLVKDSGAKAD